MKELITASILALTVATPALAESPTPWPRHYVISGEGTGGSPAKAATTPAPSWTADAQSYANWKALPAAHDAGGQSPTPQAELDAQRKRHQAYRLARHAEIVDAGFCNAPVLPPEYAAFCWGALNNANQSGGPIGAGIN